MAFLTFDFFFMFRRSKIGPNIHFGGMAFLERLLEQHNTSFLYVLDEAWLHEVQGIPNKYQRDSDVLQENLGK